jgi:hypothetical protein
MALERIRAGKVEPERIKTDGRVSIAELQTQQKDRANQLTQATKLKMQEMDTAVGLREAEAELEGTKYGADREIDKARLIREGRSEDVAATLSTKLAIAKMETDLGRETNDIARENAGLNAIVELLTQGVAKGTTAEGRLDIGAATPEQLAATGGTQAAAQPAPSPQAASADVNQDGKVDAEDTRIMAERDDRLRVINRILLRGDLSDTQMENIKKEQARLRAIK